MPIKEIAILEKEIKPYIVTSFEITSPKQMTDATIKLSQLGKFADTIEARRKEITDPLNKALKSARALFAPLEDKLDDSISIIRKAMSTYQIKAEESTRAAEQKLAAKVESGYMKPETAVAKMDALTRPDTNISTDEGSVQFRDKKCFEVMDIALVPMEYHIADESMIRKAMQNNLELKGVRYWTEKVPVNFR